MAYNKRILSEIDRELKDRYRSKRYSKSLAATNSLFTVNDLFAKPSRRRIYNPNAQYFQGGGALKAIAKNSKKILTKKDLDVIKNAAKDYKKYAIKQSDITVPAIKEIQKRLIKTVDPELPFEYANLSRDGKRLRIRPTKRTGRGERERSFDILNDSHEEMFQNMLGDLKEEADLLKRTTESYLENPYGIDLNRGDYIKFDEKGMVNQKSMVSLGLLIKIKVLKLH